MVTNCLKALKITLANLFILFVFGTGQCLAASFLADMVTKEKGDQTTARFFMHDNLYRMDVKEDARILTVLVNRKDKMTITGKKRLAAPIGRRIETGGSLIVTVNPQRHILLVLQNIHQGGATARVHPLKNNTPMVLTSMGNAPIEFKKIWDKKEISFKDPSDHDLF